VRLLFAGTPHTALPSLDALLSSRHDVIAILTRPAAPSGRGRRMSATPVALRAAETGIEVLTPSSLRDLAFARRLAELAPDCCAVVAYGNLVPAAALEVPRHGWVNLHFSVLPAWRGAAPVQHALLHGDDVTGATTFRLEESLDTGPIYGVVTEAVRPRDTAGDLLLRLADSGAHLLVATLDAIEAGDARPQPQPADGVSFAPKLTARDTRIGWQAPAVAVDRQVRACTPNPGAWTELRGDRVKLGPVDPAPTASDESLEPGELRVDRSGLLCGTGSRPVRLGEVRPQGRGAMTAADWARGLRLEAGERFTS